MTGLVVSALNHAMHKLETRNWIRSNLKDPDGVPEVSENSVNSVK